MGFHVRPVRVPEDFARMAELWSQANPEPCTVELLEEEERNRPADSPFYQIAAEDGSGYMVGFALAIRFTWHKPGKFFVETVVDRRHQRQGAGGALAAEVERWAREQGATLLEASVRDTEPEAEAFLERRGYRRDRHIFESTLDLATFDETRFAGSVERAEAEGIRFFSLADEPGEETERRLYALTCRTVRDIPGWDNPQDAPYEQWRKWNLESQFARRDGIIVAAEGDRFAGVTILQAEPEGGGMYTTHASVHPDCRGRGLALALKLLSVQVARRYGAPFMRTNNDSLNGPMLAVNRLMGYAPLPGIYRMKKAFPA